MPLHETSKRIMQPFWFNKQHKKYNNLFLNCIIFSAHRYYCCMRLHGHWHIHPTTHAFPVWVWHSRAPSSTLSVTGVSWGDFKNAAKQTVCESLVVTLMSNADCCGHADPLCSGGHHLLLSNPEDNGKDGPNSLICTLPASCRAAKADLNSWTASSTNPPC